MLEPDTTLSSSSSAFPSSPSSRPPSAGNSGGSGGGGSSGQKKRHNPSRERNAFLFGEVTAEGAAADERGVLKADQIFGLEVIRRG
jgi:TBC1 domain family protein 5